MHLPVCVLHTGTVRASPFCLPVVGQGSQPSAPHQEHCIPCCRHSALQQQLAAACCRRAEGPAGCDRPCRPAPHWGSDAAAAAALRAHRLQGRPGVPPTRTDAGSVSCMAQPQRHVPAGRLWCKLIVPEVAPPVAWPATSCLKLTVCTAVSGCRALACCPACSTQWLQLTPRHCWERRTAFCLEQLLA